MKVTMIIKNNINKNYVKNNKNNNTYYKNINNKNFKIIIMIVIIIKNKTNQMRNNII